MKAFALVIMIILAITKGCGERQSLRPADYVHWVEDPSNGLKTEKRIGEYLFVLQYKPLEYLVLKTTKDINITAARLEEEKKEIEELQYYTFQVGEAEGSSDGLTVGASESSEFYGRIQYFTSAVQRDFKLVEGKDTLPCVLHHFERTYGLTPYTSFVLGFPKSRKVSAEDKTFIYEDKVIGSGTIKITIPASCINNIPHLITQ